MTSLIPPRVLRFIVRHLRSTVDLEVLILVGTTPDRGWNAGMVATELGIPGASARESLEHLCRKNLLDVKVGETLRYRFNPGTPNLGRTVDELMTTYREARVAVTAAVTDAARQRLRDFADAFRVLDVEEDEDNNGG